MLDNVGVCDLWWLFSEADMFDPSIFEVRAMQQTLGRPVWSHISAAAEKVGYNVNYVRSLIGEGKLKRVRRYRGRVYVDINELMLYKRRNGRSR